MDRYTLGEGGDATVRTRNTVVSTQDNDETFNCQVWNSMLNAVLRQIHTERSIVVLFDLSLLSELAPVTVHAGWKSLSPHLNFSNSISCVTTTPLRLDVLQHQPLVIIAENLVGNLTQSAHSNLDDAHGNVSDPHTARSIVHDGKALQAIVKTTC